MIRLIISVIILLISGFAFAGQQTASSEKENLQSCNLQSLPKGVTLSLEKEYPSWKPQDSAYLSPSARERWKSEKPLGCAGIAVGHFNGSKPLSYAILLVPVDRPASGFKLILFSQMEGKDIYESNVLEQSQISATNAFIHSIVIDKLVDNENKRKFGIRARDGILLFYAGEKEYQVDLYYLTSNGYKNEPMDY